MHCACGPVWYSALHCAQVWFTVDRKADYGYHSDQVCATHVVCAYWYCTVSDLSSIHIYHSVEKWILPLIFSFFPFFSSLILLQNAHTIAESSCPVTMISHARLTWVLVILLSTNTNVYLSLTNSPATIKPSNRYIERDPFDAKANTIAGSSQR